MRQLTIPASEWRDIVKWVLANGFWDHIVHEDDYGYGDPMMMMWTKAQYEYALKNLEETLGRGTHDSTLKIQLYLSDDAEMHYKLKFN